MVEQTPQVRSTTEKKIDWLLEPNREPTPTKVHQNILYHGTSGQHLKSILEHGLIPAGKAGLGATSSSAWTESGGSESDMIGLVGLTDRTRSGAFYASLVSGRKHNPVILEIDRNKLDKAVLVRRRGSSVGGGKEWDYPRPIPVSAINAYWRYTKKNGWQYHKKDEV